MRVMAVGAHPDDIEFGCGAVLVKEIARGHQVRMVNLTRGESGTHGTKTERVGEAEEAAKLLGAGLKFLDLEGDARLTASPQNAMAVARVLRQWKPHILLAPSLHGNQHPDHEITGRLTRHAARLARYGGLSELEPDGPHAITALYYYDITGMGVAHEMFSLPKLIVDVSESVERWKAVMSCHRSQLKTRDYVSLQLSRAKVLGAAIGVDYAMALWANDPIRVAGVTDLSLSARRF